MVAKSFQSLEIVTEPYMVNGRQYVKVKTKTGSLHQVRWYEEREYYKMYPDEKLDKTQDKFYKSQKDILGFVNGYITIFRGETYDAKEWFKEHGAHYTRWWGWSFGSDVEVPADLPEGVEPVQLDWSLVGNGDNLKNEDLVKAAVEGVMYENEGEFVGEIGDKLEIFVTVEKAIELDGYYGRSTMHVMYDDDGNVYVWTTASKSWSEGTEHHIKGTVKDHKTYKGLCQTVLTRCREV